MNSPLDCCAIGHARGVLRFQDDWLRRQSAADRRKTIMKSLETGDDQIMSAILSAPPCLSGLSEPEVSGFALMWRQRKYPDELKRIAQLEKGLAAIQLGGTLLVSHQQKMAAPAIVAEARKFKEASAAAIRQATGRSEMATEEQPELPAPGSRRGKSSKAIEALAGRKFDPWGDG